MTHPLTRDEMAAQLRRENPHYRALLTTAPRMAERHLDRCMEDQDRDIREPWRTLTFDRTTEARGRNGWFILNDGMLCVYSGSGHLRLNAKQHGRNSPIALNFGSLADMRLLGHALLQAAEAWEDLADPANAGSKAAYRDAARQEYSADGEIEIDDNAVVSQGDDGGAYVAAWVWVQAAAEGNETEEVPHAQG